MVAHAIAGIVSLKPAIATSLRARAPGLPAPRVTAASTMGSQGVRAVVTVAQINPPASVRVPVVGDRLLNSVTLSRGAVNVGYVLTDQSFNVTLWNTDYTREATLTNFASSDPDSLEVVGPPPILRLAPGAAVQYSLTVKNLGKSTINEAVRFVVAEMGDSSPALSVFGTRLVVFPLAPDWAAGYDEELMHTTSVLTTHSGAEQRAMLREKPVRTLTYTVTALDEGEAGLLEAMLWGWQARVFGVPVWSDERSLIAGAAIGASTIMCDTSYGEFSAGGYVLVWQDSYTFDAIQVSAVQGDRIALAFPLTKAYQAGAKVVPLAFARMADQAASNHDAASASSAQLTFTVE